MNKKFSVLLVLSLLFVALAAFPLISSANHAWGNYHWARSSNPVQLNVGNNLTGPWGGHLNTAVADWNQSTVLDLTIVAGSARGQCRPTAGMIEVCNDAYGNNGWLGIAQIWVSGDHITQGTTKVNDTYFNTPQYNTNAWRQLVMCQEIGHDFGLGHQDENFDNSNLNTCMDYTSNPDSNQHPNQHDYQQLESIYGHTDGGSGGGGGGCNGRNPNCNNGSTGGHGLDVDLNNPSEWGQLVRSEGRTAIYERQFGNQRMITFVIWAN